MGGQNFFEKLCGAFFGAFRRKCGASQFGPINHTEGGIMLLLSMLQTAWKNLVYVENVIVVTKMIVENVNIVRTGLDLEVLALKNNVALIEFAWIHLIIPRLIHYLMLTKWRKMTWKIIITTIVKIVVSERHITGVPVILTLGWLQLLTPPKLGQGPFPISTVKA